MWASAHIVTLNGRRAMLQRGLIGQKPNRISAKRNGIKTLPRGAATITEKTSKGHPDMMSNNSNAAANTPLTKKRRC